MTHAVRCIMEKVLVQSLRSRPSLNTYTPMLLLWPPLIFTPTTRRYSSHLVNMADLLNRVLSNKYMQYKEYHIAM